MSATSPRLGLRFALATVLALPFFLGGPFAALRDAEAGAPPLNWTYKDKVHKFSLKMFRDYNQVPLQASQKTTVAKFRDPKSKGQARGTYDPDVEVVRILLAGSDGPVVTGGEGAPKTREEVLEAMRNARRPKTVWDATVGRLRLPASHKEALRKSADVKKIKSKDKPSIPGTLRQFDVSIGQGRRASKLHITLAEFEKDGVAIGIFMTCGEPLKKSYTRSFKKIAKSFKWYDKKAKDVKTLKVLEGVNISAKKRRDIEKSMVTNWAVIVSPKKNYIVIYNTKNGKNHLLARTIAKRIELIREQVYEQQFPPARPIDTVCIVRVCENAKEYRAYGGPPGSAGYWSPGAEELVFYDASASKKADKNTLAVLYHEAFHQYIHYSVGRVAPHSWFNEGHGDYYAGAEFKHGKFKIKPFQWRVGVIRSAIVQGERPYEELTGEDGKVTRSWERKGYTPLENLVTFSQREYYSYPGVCYAQGWSLIFFLREIVPKNKKYAAKWGHILGLYFDTLKAEVNRDGSLDRDREKRKKEAEEDEGDDADEEKDAGKKDDDPPAPTPTPTPEDGKKGDGEGKPDGGGEEGPSTSEPPRPNYRGLGGPGALKKAIEVAFKDIDWKAFQAAWLKATK